MKGCSSRCTVSRQWARVSLYEALVASESCLEHGLAELQEPVAELVPEELVHGRGGLIEAELGHALVHGATAWARRERIQRSASEAGRGKVPVGRGATSAMWVRAKRVAFQILLQKSR
jgi:hypothetical protein